MYFAKTPRALLAVFCSILFFAGGSGPVFATGEDPFLTISSPSSLPEAGTEAESEAEAAEPPKAVLTVNTQAEVPVAAKASLLMDAATGTVLIERGGNERLYPASVTKIMTLLLVCEAIGAGKLSFEETLTCSETAAAKGGSQIWLEPGEAMTVNDLLKAAFVYSANDACTLLGEAVAGSETAFVQQMNEKAAVLGMKNTHFDNCTGLDDDTDTHLTTAYDIALMARALLQYDFIQEYTTIWMDTLRGGETQIVNTNRLIRTYPGATGLKTGTTSKAGCCVCATAERDGLTLIAVVLGAGDSKARFAGAAALLDYGFANYALYLPDPGAADLPPLAVTYGKTDSVALEAPDPQPLLVNKSAAADITKKTTLAKSVEAPVAKGQTLGAVHFYAGETEIASYDLTAAADVPRLTLWDAIMRILTAGL